jgi:hypothetical protein
MPHRHAGFRPNREISQFGGKGQRVKKRKTSPWAFIRIEFKSQRDIEKHFADGA